MQGPLDLVIVEGWMLGFQPLQDPEHWYIKQNDGMKLVNELLKDYSVWEEKLDAAILVSVENSQIVFQWREQPEKERREKGEGAMTEAEVRSFCSRYLPSYDAYSPKLSEEGMPQFVEPKRTLNFKLDENRAPYVAQIKPKIENTEPSFIKVGNKYIKNQKKRMEESKIPSDQKKEQIIEDNENIIEQCQGGNNDEEEVTKRLAECMEDKSKWLECVLDEVEKEDEENE